MWTDNFRGKRTMTLREDGTATMVVEPSGMFAKTFAEHLTFEMTWKVEGGRLKKQTTGGEPAGKVALIIKAMGNRVDEQILQLDDEHLQLLSTLARLFSDSAFCSALRQAETDHDLYQLLRRRETRLVD